MMSGLETLLRPVAAMINRQISAKSPALGLCRSLDGRTMALRISNTGLAVYLRVANDQLLLSSALDADQEADVIISGTLLTLAKLAGPGGESAMQHGDIELSGDVLIAQQFQKLLYFGRPDFEEELSAVVGGIAAHGVGNALRSAGKWGRGARRTMRENIGEYLQEESRSVPDRDEVENFGRNVDTLRDDVARLEARLQNLEVRQTELDHS